MTMSHVTADELQPDDVAGAIHRIAHASFGPGDPYCGLWHLMGLLKDGVGDWQPKFSYA